MSELLGIADYVVIGIMLAISASVGLFFRFTGGRQKTTHEFLMAGKDMHIGPVAFSLMATYMSAISVLGIPAETYMYGTQYITWMVGMPIGSVIAAYGLLPVFYDMDVSTAYEYLEKRFGKTTRTISSLLFTVQMILYMAVVLYAPSLALNAVTGLSTWTSVISLAVVCTFYCSLGGLKAVLWTDVFQSVLMYVSIIAVVVKATLNIGFYEVIDIANKGGRLVIFNTSSDITERYTLWNTIVAGIVFSFHSFGANQTQLQRMMSVGNLKKAQSALLWSLPLIFFFNLFVFWDGVVVYAMFHNCDPMKDQTVNIQSPDQLIPYAIIRLFSTMPGLTGLCICGVFSASLSTISSAVNSLTAVTMEDFIRPYCFCKKLTESWAAFMAKIIAVAYGGLTLLLTFIVANFRGVIEASNIMFGMVGGPLLGVFLLGMFTKTANESGTIIGLVAGFGINAWLGFGSYLAKLYIPTLPRSIDGCPVVNNTNRILNETLVEVQISVDEEAERYILPVYKLSFLYFPLLGVVSVVLFGYLASAILKFFIVSKDVELLYLSPWVRKMHSKPSKTKKSNADVILGVELCEQRTNKAQSLENSRTHIAMLDS